jgi:SAM-dependent methyltransferase
MTDKSEWQSRVGKSWAESWQLTDRSFSGLTSQFLAMLAALPGHSILDIGCGAGELSLALARHRPDATIIGVDVSPDLVNTAKTRSAGNPSVEFELGDAAIWSRPNFAPDLLVSRHGVMFFDDPVGAFTHLHAIAAPVARLAFTCFRWPQENAWIGGIAAIKPDTEARSDPHAPGPFAFADPTRVSGILTAAGWSGVRIEPLDFAYVAGTGEEAVAEASAFFHHIGPLASVLKTLDGDERVEAEQKLEAWLRNNCHDGLVAFPAAAWQVTARKG